MVKVMKHCNKFPREAANSVIGSLLRRNHRTFRRDSADLALDYKDGLDLWNSLPVL